MQIAGEPIVLFQVAGAMVGTFGSDNTRTMLRSSGTTEQPGSLRIQHSFRGRLVSSVGRELGRRSRQLVAGSPAGQLRMHAKPVVGATATNRSV